jgi:hypothetical protein
MTYTVNLEQDGDDLILPFPKEMIKQLDWQPGDNLKWTDNQDGTFTITKINKDDPLDDIELSGC